MILGIYGYPDSGKTSTIVGLVKALRKDGLTVASVKSSAHADLAETEGKDSWKHAQAGSDPVVLLTPEGVVARIRGAMSPEEVVDMLQSSFHPDVILIEGMKEGPYPKVSMGDIKPKKGTIMSNPSLEELVAHVKTEVAVERARAKLPGLDCGKCGLSCDELARAIVGGGKSLDNCKELAAIDVSITVGDERLAVGNFVAEIVDTTVRGMLSSLKGYEPGKDVEIRLKAKRASPRKRSSKGR